MASTIRKLFHNADELYGAELIAGESGLGNLAEWVHVIEDVEVGSFLHGQEIVFTTGLSMEDTGWLMKFVENLYLSNISAFVINYGPYIKEVPEELIEFCNEKRIPLYTIPWKTRIVDMTRAFCQKIIEDTNSNISVESRMKNILFGSEDIDEQIVQMEWYGYRRDYRYNFVCISTDTEYGTQKYFDEIAKLTKITEYIGKSFHELYISFTYREKIVATLVDFSDQEQTNFIDTLFKELSRKKMLAKIHIGVGENLQGLHHQKRNFENAFMTNGLAVKRLERILFYKDMGIDKIIMAVKDDKILRQFYDDTIGKLKQYDNENDRDLYRFMRIYLEENGNVQAVCERLYIHRNTVNNYLKKIDKILDRDLFGLEQKMMLYMAYHIAEFL